MKEQAPFLATLFVETPDEFPFLIIRSKKNASSEEYSNNCHVPANAIFLRTLASDTNWELIQLWETGIKSVLDFLTNGLWTGREETNKAV